MIPIPDLSRSDFSAHCNKAEIRPYENIMCSNGISEKDAKCGSLMEITRIRHVSVFGITHTANDLAKVKTWPIGPGFSGQNKKNVQNNFFKTSLIKTTFSGVVNQL